MPAINFASGIMKYTDIKPIFAGFSQCRSLHSYGPAVRKHCIIHYCVSGKGVFKRGEETFEINKGMAFIINPDEITYYCADEKEPWFYCWIAFSGMICEKIKELEPVVSIKDDSVFYDIRKLVAEGECYPEKYLVCLIKLFEQLIPPSLDRLPSYASRAKDYIKLHYMEDIGVEQIASSMNVDRRYLLRLFKKEYGINIVNYIIKTRLGAAYSFLRSGISVNKAAVMCGYTDAYNFSKMFKKYYGIAPSQVDADVKIEENISERTEDEYIFCG